MPFSIEDSVHHGDCLAVLKTLPAESVDFILTDPPYMVDYVDRRGNTLANDKKGTDINDIWKEAARVLKPDALSFSFYSWAQVEVFTTAWNKAGLARKGHIVFPKSYSSASLFLRYTHECGFLLAKGDPIAPDNPLNDVFAWHYSGNRRHPTEKSIETLKPIIEAFTRAGDVVLDPYCGSGSSLVAAALADRRYIGIEIDLQYCEMARRRLHGVANRLQPYSASPRD